MNIVEILLQLVDASAVLALAIFAIFMLRKEWSDRLKDEKRHSEQLRQQTEQIKALYEEARDIVIANTEAMTRLIERLK